jgi:HPt (histidine-containing phosphotransfer) domain-containing protein
LAHTLKGNAGHLGKILLQRAAASVEDGLKDGRNLVTPQQMNALETELNATLVDFAPLLESLSHPEENTAGEPLDEDSARKTLDKLTELLDMGSPECRDYIGRLRRIPGSEGLIRYIDDFDFEQAALSLTELRDKLGAPRPEA